MVKYKDWVLGKTSFAYMLHAEKKFSELDKHLKQLERENAELIKRYEPKEPK